MGISFAPISILDIPNNVGTSSISMSNYSISTEAIRIDTTICTGKMTTVDSDMIPHTSQWQGTSEDVCGDHNDTTVSCDNVSIAGSDMSNKSSTIVRSSGITKLYKRKELLKKKKEKARLMMAKKRRLDEEYSANEKIMNKNQKRECRLDEEYSANEKIMHKNQKRERRLDEE